MRGLKVLAATAAMVAGSLSAASTAQAYDGCGWGYHMNRWGECRPNVRPYGVYGPRVIVYRPWGFHPHHGFYGRRHFF